MNAYPVMRAKELRSTRNRKEREEDGEGKSREMLRLLRMNPSVRDYISVTTHTKFWANGPR